MLHDMSDSSWATIATSHLFLQNDSTVEEVTLGLLIVENIPHHLYEFPPLLKGSVPLCRYLKNNLPYPYEFLLAHPELHECYKYSNLT